jgi:hypothetical protein
MRGKLGMVKKQNREESKCCNASWFSKMQWNKMNEEIEFQIFLFLRVNKFFEKKEKQI